MKELNAVIVVNTYKIEATLLAERVYAFLEQKGIGVDFFEFSGPGVDANFEKYDFAVTVGGDGTVLFAARCCADKKIPIFPINLGDFGFIAGIQKNDWQNPLELFLQKKLPLTQRSMISVRAERNGNVIFESTALNDVVLSADKVARIVTLDVSFNDNSFGQFRSDGIIIATATGSTAYAAAAGGPIIDPELDAFVLCPICPFLLSNRPLVLPTTGILKIQIVPSRGTNILITADGQVSCALETQDKVFIQKAKEKVILADCGSNIFYDALRSKLHWLGGPECLKN